MTLLCIWAEGMGVLRGWEEKNISKLPDPLTAVVPFFCQNTFPWEYVDSYYGRCFKVPVKREAIILRSFQSSLSFVVVLSKLCTFFKRNQSNSSHCLPEPICPHIKPILFWSWLKSKEVPSFISSPALTSDSVKVDTSSVLVFPSLLQSAKRPIFVISVSWDRGSESHCLTAPQCSTNELCTFMFAYNFGEVDCLYALSLASSFHSNTLFYICL